MTLLTQILIWSETGSSAALLWKRSVQKRYSGLKERLYAIVRFPPDKPLVKCFVNGSDVIGWLILETHMGSFCSISVLVWQVKICEMLERLRLTWQNSVCKNTSYYIVHMHCFVKQFSFWFYLTLSLSDVIHWNLCIKSCVNYRQDFSSFFPNSLQCFQALFVPR